MTQSFGSWTEYDNWLIQNYDKYAVISLNEDQGKISAEFIEKSEWEANQKKAEAEREKSSKN